MNDGIIPVAAIDRWRARANCASVDDPDIFFPPQGGKGKRARDLCAKCLVQAACLEYALANDEEGIWGGLDARERTNLKRKRAREKAAEEARHSGGAA